MTEEQVRHFIIAIDIQLSHFIPRDFHKLIRSTKEYRWAISNIINDACYYLTNETTNHKYDDLIKAELERISRQGYNASH